MGIKYDDYLDKTTDLLVKVLSARDIGQEESNAIALAVTEELSNNIGDTTKLRSCETIVYSELIKINDKRITTALSDKSNSYAVVEDGIRACEQQDKLLSVFGKMNWEIPNIKNQKPSQDVIILKNRLEKRSISEKIIDEDQQLSNLIQIAKTDLSVDLCDAALEMTERLESDIASCNKRGIDLPSIKNTDTKKTKKYLKALRQTSEQKEEFYSKIYGIDAELDSLISKQTSKDQWPKVIMLCQKQEQMLNECRTNNWPLPVIRNMSPSETEKQYLLYQRMNQLDRNITELREMLTSKKKYDQFLDACSEQQNNIDTCNNKGWAIPVLLNRNPSGIANKATEERKLEGKRKKLKRTAYFCIFVLSCFIALGIVGIIKYKDGKAGIPFDSQSVVGADSLETRDRLEKAGFKNVEQKSEKTGWLESGKIIEVTIGGSSEYEEHGILKGYVDENTRVIIHESSPNRIDVMKLLEGWGKLDYKTVKQKLDQAGFTQITLSTEVVSDKQLENLIAELYLNGTKYTNESCFLPKDAPIEIVYNVYRIDIPDELLGQNYEEVVSKLQQKGFTDVQSQEVTKGWNKPGSVVELTVNGKPYDSKGTYALNDRILVKYSSEDRIDLTDIVKNWKNADYEKVINDIRALGFKVVTDAHTTRTKDDNRHIEWIQIDGIQYTDGECAVHKDTKISIRYYRLQIELGSVATDYKKQQYKTVESELKEMGFNNIVFKPTEEVSILKRNEGKVVSMSIGGVKKPKAEDVFYYDEEVILEVKTRKNSHYDGIN